MTLQRLIYCSHPINPSMETVRDILKACERNNPERNLTGMLLFTSNCFLQVLEGGRSAINTQFQIISRDTRHTDIEIIGYRDIDFRSFDQWSMFYVAHTAETMRHLSRYSASATFDPYQMTDTVAEQLCLDFSLRAQQQNPGSAWVA